MARLHAVSKNMSCVLSKTFISDTHTLYHCKLRA